MSSWFDDKVEVAIYSAIIALFVWLIKNIIEYFGTVAEQRRERKKAVLNLFVDAIVFKDSLQELYTEDSKCKALDNVDKWEEGYKGYVANYELNKVADDIKSHISSLSKEEISVVYIYLETAGLFQQMHKQMGTSDFAELSKERKKYAIHSLFKTANQAVHYCDQVICLMIAKHKFLAGVKKRCEKILNETRQITPSST